MTEPWQLSIGTPSSPAQAEGAAQAGKWRNKTVLLVDSDRRSREARAKTMRSMGVRVESVSTADAARARLESGSYNLVLVDPGRDVDGAESLVNGIRRANSRQVVGFLIGSPLFVATSLSARSRPGRVRAAIPIPKIAAAPPAAASADDFGQRVKDAEAEQAR